MHLRTLHELVHTMYHYRPSPASLWRKLASMQRASVSWSRTVWGQPCFHRLLCLSPSPHSPDLDFCSFPFAPFVGLGISSFMFFLAMVNFRENAAGPASNGVFSSTSPSEVIGPSSPLVRTPERSSQRFEISAAMVASRRSQGKMHRAVVMLRELVVAGWVTQ